MSCQEPSASQAIESPTHQPVLVRENFQDLLRRLSEKPQRPSIQPTDCLDRCDISPEVNDGGDIFDIAEDIASEVEDATAALSGLTIDSQRAPIQDGVATISAAPHLPSIQASARSISTLAPAAVAFNETNRLLARPGPGHLPGLVSPGKKRYYVIVAGKCTGLYYDVW
jgi:hypothetical protein